MQQVESVVTGLAFSHRLLSIVCITLLVAACGGGSPSKVGDPGFAADGNLATVLETARSAHNVPALATVLIQDGTIIEIGAVGTRVVDGQEAVTTADQWHLGSISKSMTSTLAAVLIESGLLDWDTTVAEVLLVDIPDMRDEYRNVRVEQLMSHTGGLPVDITRSPAFQAGDINDTSPLSLTERRLVWSADLLRIPPDASVGTHLYSNSNYIVLGTLIEKVTGELWEDLIARELFAPLGMTDSGFGAPGLAGMVIQPWGHVDQDGAWQPLDPGSDGADSALAIGPAGTIHSTLRDFSAYMAAHLAGERGNDGLLLASTFARLHSPPAGTDYAGGWVVNSNGWAGSASFWHNGSNGRWFAHTVIAPDRNAAVLVVTNSVSRAAVEDIIGVMIQRFEAMPN
jgi:D-alanyl-D-alanine carboxypeptidase